jgi:hypothetical protein
MVTNTRRLDLSGRVTGSSIEDAFREKDPTEENLWIVVLIVMLVSPYLAAKARGYA